MICDLSLPGGYCTAGNCEFLGCPEAGVCITFPNTEEWCMTECSSDDDCRDGYECIDEATFLLQAEQYEDIYCPACKSLNFTEAMEGLRCRAASTKALVEAARQQRQQHAHGG